MVFLFIIVGIIVVLVFSKIRIQVKNFRFTSASKEHTNSTYEIIISLCILSKLPILKIHLTKEKLKKLKVKEKIKKVDLKVIQDKNKLDKNLLEAIKKIKLQMQELDLLLELGTENASLTAILVPIISTLISVFLRKKIENYKKQSYRVNPIYYNQNLINIAISGIFEMKMIHIITIIYILNKKEGVKKDERTSNRRSYDYSYE